MSYDNSFATRNLYPANPYAHQSGGIGARRAFRGNVFQDQPEAKQPKRHSLLTKFLFGGAIVGLGIFGLHKFSPETLKVVPEALKKLGTSVQDRAPAMANHAEDLKNYVVAQAQSIQKSNMVESVSNKVKPLYEGAIDFVKKRLG